jgi:hypothetical protein
VKRIVLFALALKAYAFLVLFVIFLQTELRNGDKGFFFRPGGQDMAERSRVVETSFWERLAPYDGQWYLDIAAHGYRRLPDVESHRGMHPPGNFAFFPLLPGVLWTVKQVAGDLYLPLTLSLTITLSAIGAAFAGLIAGRFGIAPFLTVALLVAFPSAAFRLVLYSEGLFLLLSGLALYGALEKRPVLAAVAGLLAGLSRPQGLLLALPFFWEFLMPALRREEKLSRSALLGRTLLVLTPFSGLLAMGLVSELVMDSPSAFLSIQERWGRSSSPLGIVEALASAWTYQGPKADILGLLFGVLLLPAIWLRLPRSLALYGTGMLLLPLATGSLLSLGRFLSVSIPHFLALALLLERRHLALRAGVLGGFALLQCALASGLVAWYLVG